MGFVHKYFYIYVDIIFSVELLLEDPLGVVENSRSLYLLVCTGRTVYVS